MWWVFYCSCVLHVGDEQDVSLEEHLVNVSVCLQILRRLQWLLVYCDSVSGAWILEKDTVVFTVSWLLQTLDKYRAAVWVFTYKVLLGSERFFFFSFSQVVATCLQFLFFSAAQGLIRLIVLLVSKADEDLDLTYIHQRYTALQCVINDPISCVQIKCTESPTSKQGLSEDTQFVWKSETDLGWELYSSLGC